MRTETDRPSYHRWFMDIAYVVARRSSCARRAVGCVIVDDENRILSTGYNGVPSGVTHCTSIPCGGIGLPSGSGLDTCEALHAEQNAVARLKDVDFSHVLYCTTSPCVSCVKLIAATPIVTIVAAEEYAASGKEFWTNVVGRQWIDLR